MKKQLVSLAFTAAVGLLSSTSPMLASDTDTHEFNMVVSAGAKTCLPNASAAVRVRPAGSVEIMDVCVRGNRVIIHDSGSPAGSPTESRRSFGRSEWARLPAFWCVQLVPRAAQGSGVQAHASQQPTEAGIRP